MTKRSPSNRTLAFHTGPRFSVAVHTSDAPSPQEWDAYVEAARKVPDLTRYRVLVWSTGGAPDARQRAQLMTHLESKQVRTAILTSSALMRAAATAISWFNPQLRVFAPHSLPAAFAHLGMSTDEIGEAYRELQRLCKDLGVDPPGV